MLANSAPEAFRSSHSSGNGPPRVTGNQPQQYTAAAEEPKTRTRTARSPDGDRGGLFSIRATVTMPAAAVARLMNVSIPIKGIDTVSSSLRPDARCGGDDIPVRRERATSCLKFVRGAALSEGEALTSASPQGF